jgi:catechol 2,3-dioxygenase-like lactoylglutathione lyase family enzyme
MAAAIHSVDHFSIRVPDLSEAATFYRSFGLEVRGEGDEFALSTFEDPHRWGRVREGARKAIDYVSFGAYAEDMPEFRERLVARRIMLLAAPEGAVDDSGVWFRDDDGTLVEIRVGPKVTPDAKSTLSPRRTAANMHGAPLRANALIVRPRRLQHILLFTSDVPRSIAFYRDILGLQLSDRSGAHIAFMHGVHGSDHHLVAFGQSDSRGFHHCSWDVGSINEVGLGAQQMAAAGYTQGWGLGRHVLGSNYFHYVRDPWGSYAEYSYDIDFIAAAASADGRWTARDVTSENALSLWGPPPPADFVVNYESPVANMVAR